MNDKKFSIILCTNHELMLEECLHYLNHLVIPEGYELEILTIHNASSMTEGYASAQQTSTAKYKIYMHQDVFTLNRYLLQDLLDIFHSDSHIGLIGMVGYENISPDGIMWHGTRIGDIFRSKPTVPYPPLAQYRYSLAEDGYSFAAEIDGLFMATSQDLPWNTTDLTGWDFYDAFQSIRYLLSGYKIAVPNQTHPWCLHDDGTALNMLHYNQYRRLFLNRYKDLLGKHYLDFPQYRNSSAMQK